MSNVVHPAEVESTIIGDRLRKDLTSEQKELRKLAKRIIKAVQPALEDAMRKESEINRKPYEKELRDLESLLDPSISSRRDSLSGSVIEGLSEDETEKPKPLTNGHSVVDPAHSIYGNATNNAGRDTIAISKTVLREERTLNGDQPIVKTVLVPQTIDGLRHLVAEAKSGAEGDPTHRPTPEESITTPLLNGVTMHEPKPGDALESSHVPTGAAPYSGPGFPPKHIEPPTPPLSSGGDLQTALSLGGIPWYMEPFDPQGTTIYEERWTGREVARGMSEELSDMDEEELSGLVDVDMVDAVDEVGVGNGVLLADRLGGGNRKKNGKQKRRWKGFR